MAIDRKIILPDDSQDPARPAHNAQQDAPAPASETQPLLRGRPHGQSRNRSRSRDVESDSSGAEDGQDDEEARSRTASSRRGRDSRRDLSADLVPSASSTHYGAISTSTHPLTSPESDPSTLDDTLNDEPPPAYEPRLSQDAGDERDRRRMRRIQRRKRMKVIRNWVGIGLVVLVLGGVVGMSILFVSRRSRHGFDGSLPPKFVVPPNSTRIRWSDPPQEVPLWELPDYMPFPVLPIYESNATVRIPFPKLRPDHHPTAGIRNASGPHPWTGSMDDILFVHCVGSRYVCKIEVIEAVPEKDYEDSIEAVFLTMYTSLQLRDSAKVYAVLETKANLDAQHSFSNSDDYLTMRQQLNQATSIYSNSRPPTPPENGNASIPVRRGIIIASDPSFNVMVDPDEVGVLGIGVQLRIPPHMAIGRVEMVMDTDDAILEWNATALEGDLKSMTVEGKESRITFNSPVTALESIAAFTKSGVIQVNRTRVEAPRIVFAAGDGRIQARQLRSSDEISLSVSHGDLYAELEAPTASLRTRAGALSGSFNISSVMSFDTSTGNIDASVLATRPRHLQRRQRRRQAHDDSQQQQQHYWSIDADGVDEDEVYPVQIRGITEDGTVELTIDQEPNVRLGSLINTTNGNIHAVHKPSFQGLYELFTETGEIARAEGPAPDQAGPARFWSMDLLMTWFRSELCQGRVWIRRPGRVDPPDDEMPDWPDYGSTRFLSRRGQVRVKFE
ncbi:unnamed protein product [Tilletia controversa]|nr:unnamed protein product [Tilletia controversa]CAD6925389.1 unnamed protein product [Tilletia controversa]